MFNIENYTVVMAVLWASVAILAAALLLRRSDRPWLVALILGLAVLRLAVPIQYLGTPIIHDWWIWPNITKLLRTELWDGFTVKNALLWLWLLGSCIGVLRHIWQMLLLKRVCKRAITIESSGLYETTAAEMGWKKPTRLAVSQEFSSPVSVGLLHPCILLPGFYEEYSQEQLSCVLAHEIGHHKRKDLWRLQGISLLKCALWWHPCVWLLAEALRNDLEIQCDKLACREMDDTRRAMYYGTVLQTLRLSGKAPLSGVMQFAGREEEKSLKRRVHIAFEPLKKLSKRTVTAIVSLCLVTFVLSYFLVWQPASHAPTDGRIEHGYTREEMGGADWVEENEATPFIVCIFGEYQYMENGVCTRILSEEDLQLPEYSDLEIYIVDGG